MENHSEEEEEEECDHEAGVKVTGHSPGSLTGSGSHGRQEGPS